MSNFSEWDQLGVGYFLEIGQRPGPLRKDPLMKKLGLTRIPQFLAAGKATDRHRQLLASVGGNHSPSVH